MSNVVVDIFGVGEQVEVVDIGLAAGPAGPPGPKGTTGTTGSQGPQGVQGPPGIWIQMTQAAYDVLTPKDLNTLYVIVG